MDKPQLDELTVYAELAAYVERHAEFYPNARAKPTAEGLAESEKLEKRWLQQWKQRRCDALTFVPHFQLRDYAHSALRKDLACRDAGWLGLWSDWEDHNQCPVGHARSPYSSLVGDTTGVESVVIYCILYIFWGQSPVGLRFLWWPEPGGPKILVRGPAVPGGGNWIPHGTI